MNNRTRQAITAALQQYVREDKRLSQNEIAEKLNMGVNYISAMINGEDKVGNTTIKDGYWEDVAKLIGVSLQKEYWETKPTKQLYRVLSGLENARTNSSTVLLIGSTGSGKSYTTHIFRQKHAEDTYVVVVGQSDTLSDLIEKMTDATGTRVGSGSKRKRIQAVVETLKRKKRDGKHPVLIFDEAEYLRQPALCSFKELYDHLNGVCGLVMIGTEQLLDNLDRLRKRNKQGIPQLYRRLKFGIQRLEAIDTRFTEFLRDIEDRELVKWLRLNCENYGELHDVLVPALREADRMGKPLSMDLVRLVFNLDDK